MSSFIYENSIKKGIWNKKGRVRKGSDFIMTENASKRQPKIIESANIEGRGNLISKK